MITAPASQGYREEELREHRESSWDSARHIVNTQETSVKLTLVLRGQAEPRIHLFDPELVLSP